MDKRLLEDFVLKCNQWKYWMSFIACGCRFPRNYTVYSWLSKGWLLGIWAYQTMEWFPWVTTKQWLTIAQFPIPKATFIKPAVHVCSVCIKSWLFKCNKLNVKISCSWNFLGIPKQKNNHFRLNWVSIYAFYLPTIHTFILARPTCNTIMFDSTKIIMTLARPEPEHSLLVLWLVLLCVSERGRTQSLIDVTHLVWEQECNLARVARSMVSANQR